MFGLDRAVEAGAGAGAVTVVVIEFELKIEVVGEAAMVQQAVEAVL